MNVQFRQGLTFGLHTPTQTNTRTHTHTHINTHARARTHTHTHIHAKRGGGGGVGDLDRSKLKTVHLFVCLLTLKFPTQKDDSITGKSKKRINRDQITDKRIVYAEICIKPHINCTLTLTAF